MRLVEVVGDELSFRGREAKPLSGGNRAQAESSDGEVWSTRKPKIRKTNASEQTVRGQKGGRTAQQGGPSKPGKPEKAGRPGKSAGPNKPKMSSKPAAPAKKTGKFTAKPEGRSGGSKPQSRRKK
jgi:hypothetical protein